MRKTTTNAVKVSKYFLYENCPSPHDCCRFKHMEKYDDEKYSVAKEDMLYTVNSLLNEFSVDCTDSIIRIYIKPLEEQLNNTIINEYFPKQKIFIEEIILLSERWIRMKDMHIRSEFSPNKGSALGNLLRKNDMLIRSEFLLDAEFSSHKCGEPTYIKPQCQQSCKAFIHTEHNRWFAQGYDLRMPYGALDRPGKCVMAFCIDNLNMMKISIRNDDANKSRTLASISNADICVNDSANIPRKYYQSKKIRINKKNNNRVGNKSRRQSYR
jgi:hypothetical protein